MAGGACRLPSVSGQHHTILYLILVLSQHAEKLVDADGAVAPFVLLIHSMPKHLLLSVRQLVVRREDGEILILVGSPDKFLLPLRHLFSLPACHTAVIHRQVGVGDDQTLVNPYDASVALALGAGSHRRIEREHLVGRFFKLDAVCLKLQRKLLHIAILKFQHALSIPLIQGRVG